MDSILTSYKDGSLGAQPSARKNGILGNHAYQDGSPALRYGTPVSGFPYLIPGKDNPKGAVFSPVGLGVLAASSLGGFLITRNSKGAVAGAVVGFLGLVSVIAMRETGAKGQGPVETT